MLVVFTVHLVSYAAVSASLTLVWLMGGGQVNDLARALQDPALVTELNIWPAWVVLGWGTAVLIHAGFVVALGLFGRRARRRRRELARSAAKAGEVLARETSRAARAVTDKRRPQGPGPQRRWVTVLFSDIADSTKLTEALGDERWSEILTQYRRVVRDAVRERGGDEVGTQGDGLLARFPSPAEAVLCGVDIQRAVAGQRESDPSFPLVRIGVHAGEAVHDDGDLVGRVVNLASRVTSEARPGEILVTEPVADQLVGHLDLEDRGLRPLKGVSQPRHLLAVVWSEQRGTTRPVTNDG